MAEKEVFCDKCGIRDGVPNVLVVFTDGNSNGNTPVEVAAQGLKVLKIIMTYNF